MSGSHGTRAVLAALGANLGVAATKFVAFAFTGSASMLSEGIHSVVDSTNQVLLLVGGRQSRKPADERHPFGYGRRRFVYGFVVAVLLFLLGGVFSLYEGWHKWVDPQPLERPWIAIVVLATGILLEGASFRVAVGEANKVRGRRSIVGFLREARQPEIPVILLEDAGAMVGLLLAMLGVVMSAVTGNGRWDAVGAISIGLLLVVVAMFLTREVATMLVGESALPEDVAKIRKVLREADGVERVYHLKTMHVGPEELLVVAKIRIAADDSGRDITADLDAAEAAIRAAVPQVKHVYLDPDGPSSPSRRDR